MDTDNLSLETYNGIIITAEMFHHDLTLRFAVLANDCKNDNDFINVCEQLIKEWLKAGIEEIIDEIFYDELPDVNEFKNVLYKILYKIIEIRKIPIDKRAYEAY